VSGWPWLAMWLSRTATVRPATSFTQALKGTMMTPAGLNPKDAIKYEPDHFVPLAIGGHPRWKTTSGYRAGTVSGMRA